MSKQGLTLPVVLAAVARCGDSDVLTEDVVDEVGRTQYSRHQVYRRLTALERQGLLGKDISHCGGGIGMALWSLTPSGVARCAEGTDHE